MQGNQQDFYTPQDKTNAEKKLMDDVKTAAEHEAVILKFLKTGELDRDDAIKKYNSFNSAHPEYYIGMAASATVSGSAVPIDTAPNNVIVGNLQAQLLYLSGKNMLEGMRNG